MARIPFFSRKNTKYSHARAVLALVKTCIAAKEKAAPQGRRFQLRKLKNAQPS